MREFNWIEQILIVSGFVAVLILGAVLLFVLCFFTSRYSDDDEDTRTTNNNNNNNPEACRRGKVARTGSGVSPLVASGKQTMVSTLRRAADARSADVLLATAMSSIPLKEFGTEKNDIIVDISQQLHLNDSKETPDDQECIICKGRRDSISWKGLVCYAQTSVGVLVYKKQADEQPEANK